MPITKSAIKKQRVDKRRSAINEPIRGRVKAAIKIVRSKPSTETLAQFYAAIDRAVAKKLVSKRTAARMKARVVKATKIKLTKSPFGKN
ncbi:MAG: 30S ribosomal protein S20 [Microgenomates group bacterium GW2011_GWC1_46_16]|jgi:ribosomal protein S20|uniref:Small ribosomal subunit protein bS20 n=2 Tax=Candidatus Collieribacteriota TaxID=1752725 RepID=A0A1F5FY90_9BACT|nr:MAG: 30S ribosomal protein S20 [Microgenomates group bacterium GW2011_GWF1_46_12]KKU26937.1 MAG: 30S ribosomal protein S20 [Microgenomates group bacterium GW2011_GWC1_46_16]KKU28354.1 MAG: 30S ribosomal protein S20 [Microgenomates group bacterium GW2011_GWF2_46_18]KKU44024.1 MAG: 30S ribosomal protein S20 [Microgenomates group bacterium GW2011_GWA1_46_7]KKU62171.1 MAG: 30S ribosomal protein S20 [Microgenomates group bacterium GW2011_GWE1_47_12]KKU62294.1 MAG: 30S ribosomal protein S20 [Micr